MRKPGGKIDVSRGVAAGLAVVATIAVAAVGLRESGKAGSRMTPQSASASEYAAAPAGSAIKVVLRVVSKSDRTARAALLTKRDGTFTDTGRDHPS